MTTNETILMELASVRRRCRRIEAAAMVLVLSVVGALLMGQAGPWKKVVQAERFEVVDKDGAVRGFFSTGGQRDNAVLGLTDGTTVRATFMVASDGIPSLGLQGKDGVSAARVLFDERDSPMLLLYGGEGKGGLGLRFDSSGNPTGMYVDSKGSHLDELPVMKK